MCWILGHSFIKQHEYSELGGEYFIGLQCYRCGKWKEEMGGVA